MSFPSRFAFSLASFSNSPFASLICFNRLFFSAASSLFFPASILAFASLIAFASSPGFDSPGGSSSPRLPFP